MNKDWKEELRKKMEDFEVEAPQGLWEELENQLFTNQPKKVVPLAVNKSKTNWVKVVIAIAAVALLFIFIKPLLTTPTLDLDKEVLPNIKKLDENTPTRVTQQKTKEEIQDTDNSERVGIYKEESNAVANKNKEVKNSKPFITPSISTSILNDASNEIKCDGDNKDFVIADNSVKEEVFDKELVEAELKELEAELFASEQEKEGKVNHKGRWIGGLNSGGSFTNDKQQFTGYGTISGKSLSYTSLYMEEASGFKTTFNDIIRANMYQNAITDVKHKAPITASISVGYQLTDKWTVSSGLTYTKLSSELKSGTPSNSVMSEQSMHYLGVPMQISYKVITSGSFSLYTAAGGLFEKSISGEVKTRYIVDDKVIDSDKKSLNESTIQVSVNGGIGAEYMITKHLGFYVEPGVQYHIKNNSEIGTIYKEKPFSFNTKVGIRLLFAK